jgi:hypothetical protein
VSARFRAAGALLVTVLLALAATGCGGFGGFGGGTHRPGGYSTDSLPTAPATPALRTYVSLGDGFAAAPYVGATVDAHGCLRSRSNYAQRIAQQLHLTLTDVSCTGASTSYVLHREPAPNGHGRLAAQISAVNSGTDLVTLTAGLGDGALLYRVFYACAANPCAAGRIAPSNLADEAGVALANVKTILTQIYQRAPKAYVVLVGYPKIAPPTKSCGKLPTLTKAELALINLFFDQFNRQLQILATGAGAGYADLGQATSGHDVCAKHSWIRSPLQKAPLHPNPAEQAAAAAAILAQIKAR